MRNLKRALSLALSTVMLLGMMVVGTSASYADVDAQDNLEAIEVLQMTGIMTGDENGNFNPDKNVTRNEMAVIMCNLLDLNKGGVNPFTDVPTWADPYVSACYANGIIAGISADKFGGESNVTTAQASLMVMKALGYFGYQGEFGDNWTVATIKQGTKIDLFDGIDAGATAALSRSEVAQLVLNALESPLVVVTEQGGLDVSGNGISVSQKPTYTYAYAAKRDGINYNNANNSLDSAKYQELTEKLFGNKLKKTSTGEDAFGRPATKWTYGTDSVTAPEGADLTYTAEVKGKEIYNDLGKVTPKSITYIEDGYTKTEDYTNGDTPAELTLKSDDSAKIGGNGTVVEVYYNDETENTYATIVVINSYVGEVNDCDKNDDDKYDIVLDNGKKFESAVDFDYEDIVLYTMAKTDVKSMVLADKTTGEVTRVKNADSFVLDGETYKYAKAFEGSKLTATAVDFDVDVYTDAYGYVVKLDNSKASTNYAVVVGVAGAGWDENDSTKEVKLLFPDGTVEVVTAEKWTGTLAKNSIVTYTVNSDDEYNLVVKDAAEAATGALKVSNGKATVTVDGETYTATSKTEFFLYDSTDKEYTTYTGIKNVSSLAAADNYSVAVVETNDVLKAVYIMSSVDVVDNQADTAAFFYVKGDEKLIKDTDLGDYYEVKAVIDGEATTKMVSTSVYAAFGKESAIVSKIKTNDDEIITGVTIETNDAQLDSNGDGYKIGALAVEKAEDDVIGIAGTGYAYADDATIFEYNADDGFVSKTISSLKTQTYNNMFVQIDDNTVIAIFYVK